MKKDDGDRLRGAGFTGGVGAIYGNYSSCYLKIKGNSILMNQRSSLGA